MQGLQKPEEGTLSSGTRVSDGCEPSGGCWEPDPGLLEGKLVLLPAEPLLQLSNILTLDDKVTEVIFSCQLLLASDR